MEMNESVLYTRYSSKNQDKHSTDGQLNECYAFAEKNGYKIIGEYNDIEVSGTTANRPKFQKMIEDSKKGNFKFVIVYQFDRFARSRKVSAVYKDILKENGVKVISVKEVISDEPEGVILESVLEGYAEYFSRDLSRKVLRGMKLNAEQGLYCGGGVPLGLRLQEVDRILKANGKTKYLYKFDIDPTTAPIVQEIFKMYANGVRIVEINEYLNQKGVKTAYGGEFNKNSLCRLLQNKKYIGYYTFAKTELKDKIPPIVSEELFNAVQAMVAKHKHAPAINSAKSKYLLTTKIACGKCGSDLVAGAGTSQSSDVHRYYVCKGRYNKTCDLKNHRKSTIEDIVIRECRKYLTDTNISRIAKLTVNMLENSNTGLTVKRLEKLITQNEKESANLMKSIRTAREIDESIVADIFKDIQKLKFEKTELESNLARENAVKNRLTESHIKYFLHSLKTDRVTDHRYRQNLIDTLVNKVLVYDDKITLILNVNDTPITVDNLFINSINALDGNVDNGYNNNDIKGCSSIRDIEGCYIETSGNQNFLSSCSNYVSVARPTVSSLNKNSFLLLGACVIKIPLHGGVKKNDVQAFLFNKKLIL